MPWLRKPIATLLLVLVLFVSCEANTFLLRQSAALPDLDPEPTIQEGHAAVGISMRVKSPQFGLGSVVTNGIKLFLSQHLSVPPESFYLTEAAVEDPAESLYVTSFTIVVPVTDAQTVEAQARDYVDSDGLADDFAKQGVVGMEFTLLDDKSDGSKETAAEEVTPTPEATPVEVVYDPNVNVSALVDVVPVPQEGFETSRKLEMYVQSPTIYFPLDLKKAIRWFLGEATGTKSKEETWFMPDMTVLNTTFGEYITTFVHLGKNESGEVITRAERFIENGGIDSALRDAGAKDVNVSLLPQLPLPTIDPVGKPQRGFTVVDVVFQVKAPISGIAGRVESAIKQSIAEVTSTKAEGWRLRRVAEEGHNGPFDVDFAHVVEKGVEAEIVRNVSTLIRSRRLDYEMWELGMRDVEVRLRVRLTAFDREGSGSGGSAISSTAGTVAASVAGMMLVFAIGAGILCLVPRGDHVLVQSRSQGEEPFHTVRQRWRVWR